MIRQTTTPRKDLDDGTNTLSEEDREKLQERSERPPEDEREGTERDGRGQDE